MTKRFIETGSPEELIRTFATLIEARDLDRLVALYEPDAVFEPRPGIVVRGVEAIRSELSDLLALEPHMTTSPIDVLRAGDVALVINEWSLTGSAPDGREVRQGGCSSDVVRRQADGRWLVLVDKP